ncbi:MAG: uracil-DNA glycosylase [bacterium]
MKSYNKSNLIIDSLLTQKEIFGDELYTSLNLEKIKTSGFSKIEQPRPLDLNVEEKEIKKEPVIHQSNIDTGFMNAKSIDELFKTINNCKKCSLGETRTKFVFGTGNPNADILLVGEAPGAEEDKTGEPFVGRAGKLLTDILGAIDIKREDVFIANILKCRPPNNRTPVPEEVLTCIPYLKKQIDLIKPKMILCLGVTAANGLLNAKNSLTKMRGNVYEFHNVKLMVTYHPAALLRNPNWKKECWEDVQKFKKLYLEMIK